MEEYRDMGKTKILAGEQFFELLCKDQDFCAQMGRTLLVAGRMETKLKKYLIKHSVNAEGQTLGSLLKLLKDHNLLKRMRPALNTLRLQRNIWPHNVYDLLTGSIRNPILPNTKLIADDVHLFTGKARELEENLTGIAELIEKAG